MFTMPLKGHPVPLVRASSVILVFNRAHLVYRAIDSARQQPVLCEGVLVDHGSTDPIGGVARRCGNRIHYVRREHPEHIDSVQEAA